MIEQMEKLYIYSLKGQSTDIMEDIMRCGVMQQARTRSMLPEETAGVLQAGEGRDLSREEQLLEELQESIRALKPFSGKKGLFDKRPVMSYEELTDDQILMDAMVVCRKVRETVQEMNEKKNELHQAEFQKTSLTPWKSMDLPLEEMRTESCRAACYVLQAPRTIEDIWQAAQEKEIGLYAEQIAVEKENQYVAVLFHKKDEKEMKESIRLFGAREISTEGMTGTFNENISRWEGEIARLESEVRQKEQELEQMAVKQNELETASDAVKVRIQCLSGQEDFLRTEKVDIITGWVPASQKERLERRLEKYDCFTEYRKPEKDEDYPVLMKNSKLVAPFGALTEMYSLPNPHSMDSNWAIGLFFFIFFGMMLSDAGYGLLLTIGGLGGARLLDMGEGGKRFLTMLGISGISTMFWGLIYGSFFGDVIPTVAEVFFGKSIELPKLIDPLNQPMVVLGLSCALGVIHLFIGMGFKAYLMIKRGDIWGAVFDVGFWYIFLIGLPCLILPGRLKMIGIVMSIAGAVGLVLTQGRAKPTIFGKITSGVMSLYDVTGYFSDVLSYSRILALGLATGVIASVVNTIGTLTGSGIIGAILFIVIFAAGHALNMAINALGAYVHSARLQYVEFFGKYYESGGKKFDPLRAKTKYVNVTEEK